MRGDVKALVLAGAVFQLERFGDVFINENIAKAFELKDRASEHERFYITSHYYGEVQRDVEKTTSTYQNWISTYPHDTIPRDNLSLLYQGIGQYAKALASATEAMRADPKDSFACQNLVDSYMGMNRFEEMKAILDKADAQGMYLVVAPFARFDMAFMQHDNAGMRRAIDNARDDFGKNLLLLFTGES